MRIWQGIHDDIGQLVERYERDVSTEGVPFPGPRYLGHQGYPRVKVQDFVYLMLKMFAHDGTKAVEVICPKGFTECAHDFSMSFHIGAAICAAKASASLSPFDAEYIANSFATQLIAEGYWEWAVFVTLFVIGDVSDELKDTKVQRAKSIVFRYYDEGNEGDQNLRVFLEEQVGLPSSWFSEAAAFRAASRHDIFSFVNNAVVFHKEGALKLMEEKYLVAFGNSDDGHDYLDLLKHFAEGFPASMASLLLRVVALERRCPHPLDSNVTDDSLDAFLEDVAQVNVDLLTYRGTLKTSRSPFAWLFPSDPSPIPLTAVVSATLQRVQTMQLHMKALAHRRSQVSARVD